MFARKDPLALTADVRPDFAVLFEALLSGRGEASGVARAREILDLWQAVDDVQKRDFLCLLARDFGPPLDRLEAAIDAYRAEPGPATLGNLHKVSEPRRQELLRRLNLAPGGIITLVAMREFLLQAKRDEPILDALDDDFEHLFSSWFNRGFLVLQRIDWSTPANVLERIIRYEAVHQIHGWDELRRRLAPPDRRLYAFFHPQLIEDPLIFVEVALAQDIPATIQGVLAEQRDQVDPARATTAVFYSISNTQVGSSRRSSSTTCLIRKLPKEMPLRPTWVFEIE
nr:malonyl-CoA decarboxylase family protein [Oleomonas cavernae]